MELRLFKVMFGFFEEFEAFFNYFKTNGGFFINMGQF
jgi:hypothetical protein